MDNHDQSKTWKYFEQNELTHSTAHYLMTIYDLKEKDGYARLSDIASHMDITAGSCKITLSKLVEKQLVYGDEKKFYHLTDVGQELALRVAKNEALFQQFFHTVLGVEKWQSEIDACKIEHLISAETSASLCSFLRYMETEGLLVDSFLQGFERFRANTSTGSCDRCDVGCGERGSKV